MGWVSVDDLNRSPTVYEVVPILHESHIKGHGAIDGNGTWWNCTGQYKLRNVTHWFDLPALPEM